MAPGCSLLQVTVVLTGRLEDGTVFDSYPQGEELVFCTDTGGTLGGTRGGGSGNSRAGLEARQEGGPWRSKSGGSGMQGRGQ